MRKTTMNKEEIKKAFGITEGSIGEEWIEMFYITTKKEMFVDIRDIRVFIKSKNCKWKGFEKWLESMEKRHLKNGEMIEDEQRI